MTVRSGARYGLVELLQALYSRPMRLWSDYQRWRRTPNRMWRLVMFVLLLGILGSVGTTISGLYGTNFSGWQALWFFGVALAAGALGIWCWWRVWRSRMAPH